MVSIQTGDQSAFDVAHQGLSRRTLLRAALFGSAIVAVPGALVACSPQTTNTTPSSGGATGPVNTTKAFRVGWKSDIDTLNPLTTVTTEAVEVQSLIYDTLLAYGLDLTSEPSLATSAAQAVCCARSHPRWSSRRSTPTCSSTTPSVS